MVGCIGVTEPDAGSDVASIRTRAESDGDEWVINGRKLYITNGTQADWVCLLARTSDEGGFRGMSLIIVPTNAPGFSVSRKLRKLGNHSSDTAELMLDNVRVPKANTIGPEGMGFILQMQQFQRERLVGAITTYSSLSAPCKRYHRLYSQRCAFGQPLIDNQAIHFRMAELLTEIEILKQFCYAAVEKMVDGEDITREASMAKLKAGRLAREVTDSCLQYYGGMGYMEETPISRAYRDARLLSIGGGRRGDAGHICKLRAFCRARRRRSRASVSGTRLFFHLSARSRDAMLRIGSAEGFYGDDDARAAHDRGRHADVARFEAARVDAGDPAARPDAIPTGPHATSITAERILPLPYRKIPLITRWRAEPNRSGGSRAQADRHGLHGLKIATVTGDDLLA
jgi:hypothetical protein